MKMGYYPGCSLHGTSPEFDESMKAVAGKLDVELQEVDDWSCCGATSAHATNHLLSLALPARNLAMAEAQGIGEVVAPCAACYSRLATARHEVAHDPKLAALMPKVLARPFHNTVGVRNVVELLQGRIETLKDRVTMPLKDLKPACYYGCLLVRPNEITNFDDPENPASMEDVCRAAGADPVKWNLRLECCGGAFSLSRKASVVRLGSAILKDAAKAGANCVVVACPMCHSNLDFRQKAMAREGVSGMPVIFLTQLVGLALGVDAKALGLDRHFVPTKGLVELARGSAPAAPAV